MHMWNWLYNTRDIKRKMVQNQGWNNTFRQIMKQKNLAKRSFKFKPVN